MKELLGKMLEIEDVEGVSFMSFKGDVIIREKRPLFTKEIEQSGIWPMLFEAMQGIREADLVFEKTRLYIRRTELGYLVVIMSLFAPAAMVRMNCDLLLPSLKQGKSKGLRDLFRKKS